MVKICLQQNTTQMFKFVQRILLLSFRLRSVNREGLALNIIESCNVPAIS